MQNCIPENSETLAPGNPPENGALHGLWLTGNHVLEVILPRYADAPANSGQLAALNGMIRDLARAALAVIYQARNDDSAEAEFLIQPLEGIADAVVLLLQLSDAVQSELQTEARP